MADAIIAAILQQLAVIMDREVNREVRLVIGVKKDVQKLTSNLETLQSVLMDAEKRQVDEGAVRIWLDKLRDISYDMDDVLDEWNTAILRSQIEGETFTNGSVHQKKRVVCSFLPFSCLCFEQVVLRRDIALSIKEINEDLDAVVREKERYNFRISSSAEEPLRLKSTSFVDVSEIRGRDEEKNVLRSKLLCESSEEQKIVHVISIAGMGGIGKTTLAQLVYNDVEVVNNFEKRIWVSVSDPFDELRIAKAIIEALQGVACNLVELESLLQYIHGSIAGKKFLLVLDDVWTEDYNRWEPLYNCLKNGLCGSKILITTRKETVARVMKSSHIVTVKELSEGECWLLFKRLAFLDKSHEECEKLEEVGRKIVGKCRGLPLAAKTIGSLLRFKKTREEWQSILDSEMWKLEEFEKGLFPPLLLSYNDLPSMVRRCFSFCAIFPKDHDIDKDQLIKLWMAQGYLGLEQSKELETIGQEYFDALATRSFFQDFVRDDDGSITKCKMHDIVHDFAQFLTKNECFAIEGNDLTESSILCSFVKARHSMLILGKVTSFPISIFSIKKLRSLVIEDSYYSLISMVLPKLFNELPCLRALDMRGHHRDMNLIKMIPREIGKLIHLRYLNLSKNGEIEELPETLCELYNLQTLDLGWCTNLKRLPHGIGKLINLRHLINDATSLSYMPKGIERLTSLRTLSILVVNGGSHGSKVCTLDCLKNLNHIRGSLVVRGLGNATNTGEAKQAELKDKKNLFYLGLYFDFEEQEERMNEDEEVVLEALQPPPDLERLEIVMYEGNTLSLNWMNSLTKLRMLTLSSCMNCEYFPPLGKLSSLESLYIWKMRSVKKVGNEFLGIGTDGASSSSSLSVVFFPKLKSLEFWDMEEWEEWDYEITRRGVEDIAIMPCLNSVRLGYCPKLKAFPNHLLQTTLEKIKIVMCPTLEISETFNTIINHH
ncbi:Disease resistance protein [Melia azedarach]|uniref:Disease resistance protein n=1 Tax=Melia azedarach TaxID=155640 RepID=A0ACC1Y2R6_MELAZ|nr:Disease resistance protein [Melia azedarach]